MEHLLGISKLRGRSHGKMLVIFITVPPLSHSLAPASMGGSRTVICIYVFQRIKTSALLALWIGIPRGLIVVPY